MTYRVTDLSIHLEKNTTVADLKAQLEQLPPDHVVPIFSYLVDYMRPSDDVRANFPLLEKVGEK